MNPSGPTGESAPLEILAECEGPAIPAPGVLFDEQKARNFSVETPAAELASWIAVAALSGMVGNSAYEAIKAKVVDVLTAWRRRWGSGKIDEVKQQLFQQMQKYRNHRKITDEELRERIERLFDEIRV